MQYRTVRGRGTCAGRGPALLEECELGIRGNAFHPRVHLAFAAEEVLQGGLTEHLVDHRLHSMPERTDGTIHRAGADLDLAGVLVAKVFGFEETAAEYRHDIADDDLRGRTGQHIT